jgi:hypothetical protein
MYTLLKFAKLRKRANTSLHLQSSAHVIAMFACSRVLTSFPCLPSRDSKRSKPPRRTPTTPRAFHYDVQEMEDDETRRAREAKARVEFKSNALSGGKRRAFPIGIDPTKYTIEQLAFLSRKELGIMPDMNDCAICDGIGTLVCTSCHGSGCNAGSHEKKFNDVVRLNSNSMHGKMVLQMLTEEGAPCWICRGAKIIACTQCEGSGKRDFAENYICD